MSDQSHINPQRQQELLPREAAFIKSSTPSGPLHWGFFDFFLIFIGQQGVSIMTFALFTAMFPLSTPTAVQALGVLGDYGISSLYIPEATSARLYLLLAATLLSNLFVMGLYFFRGRIALGFSWPKLGWVLPTKKQALLWPVFFFSSLFTFNFLYQLTLKWLSLGKPTQQVADFFSANQPLGIQILGLVLVLFAAPVAEELLYRGILFKSLSESTTPHKAAIISGLIFGAIHIEVLTIIPLAFLGYILALSFHYSRSIWVPIALHAANNLMAFAFLHLFR